MLFAVSTGVVEAEDAFPSGQCPCRAPTLLGLSFSGVAVLSSPATPTETHCHRLITSAQTGRARRDLGAQEWHTPCRQVLAARGWGLQGLGTGTATALSSPAGSDEFRSSCSPLCVRDVLCASILFTFLPISIQFDCGQSLVDGREGRGGLIQSFYLALCLIKTTTNGTV